MIHFRLFVRRLLCKSLEYAVLNVKTECVHSICIKMSEVRSTANSNHVSASPASFFNVNMKNRFQHNK